MWRFKNVALDDVLEKYKCKNLRELNRAELVDIARDPDNNFNVVPKWRSGMSMMGKIDYKTFKNPSYVFDKEATVRAIEDTVTVPFNIWVDIRHWNDIFGDDTDAIMNIHQDVAKHVDVTETYEYMQRMQLGLYKLRPGTFQDIRATEDWIINDLIKVIPMAYKWLTIEDIDNGRKVNADRILTQKSVKNAKTGISRTVYNVEWKIEIIEKAKKESK